MYYYLTRVTIPWHTIVYVTQEAGTQIGMHTLRYTVPKLLYALTVLSADAING
jgi:hypothetical protein